MCAYTAGNQTLLLCKFLSIICTSIEYNATKLQNIKLRLLLLLLRLIALHYLVNSLF